MLRRDFLRASLLGTVSAHAAPKSANWPAFRGIDGSGVCDEFPTPTTWNADPSAGPPQNIRWKTAVPGLGHSSPIIWEDRVFLATAVSAKGDAPLKLGLYGDRTQAEDNGEQAWKILCFDKTSGKPAWVRTARLGAPRAGRHLKATHANTTLATDGKVVVAFFGSEGLYCYSLDGKLLWSKDLGVINVSKYGVGWGYASSPALHGDRIIVQCDAPDQAYIAAFSTATGKELWRTSRREVCERSWASPFVYDDGGVRRQVVANGWPYVVSYSFETGKELWRLKSGGDNPIPTPFGANGLIYVANGHGGVTPIWAIRPQAEGDISLAENATSNKYVVWCRRTNGAYLQTPLAYRDWVFSGTNEGVLKCYDARSGQMHYQQRLGSGLTGFSASPVAADGKVYCSSEDGEIYVLEAGPEYKVLAVNRMAAPVMATPAISAGVLYFRTLTHLVAVGGRRA